MAGGAVTAERWDFVSPWPPTREERAARTARHWERQVITREQREAEAQREIGRWADDGGRER